MLLPADGGVAIDPSATSLPRVHGG
jgi:hypothetical protein